MKQVNAYMVFNILKWSDLLVEVLLVVIVNGNHPIRIYDSVWNKKGCYLHLLTPEMMKLLESTKSKITDENDENVPPLEITKFVLVQCDYKEFSIIESSVYLCSQ